MASDIGRVTLRPTREELPSQQQPSPSSQDTNNGPAPSSDNDIVDVRTQPPLPVEIPQEGPASTTSHAEEERANLVALTTRLQIEQQESSGFNVDSQKILSYFR